MVPPRGRPSVDAPRAARETGWRVHHHLRVASTNDEATRLREEGASARTVVVADVQTQGRGRQQRAFASPAGGLYASLLIALPPAWRPSLGVAWMALAAAEAAESQTGTPAQIKWPNDLWIGNAKAGGILLEASGNAPRVVAGIGINVAGVPAGLPADVAASTTCLDQHAPAPVDATALLVALLQAVDRWAPTGPHGEDGKALAQAWTERLAWRGRHVTWRQGPAVHAGVLQRIDLHQGLLVRTAHGEAWHDAAHVQDLRLAPEGGVAHE